MQLRQALLTSIAAGALCIHTAQATTLQDALASVYATNPTLLAARAQLRAVDENVPTALAGWRPTITFSPAAGYGGGNSRTFSNGIAVRSDSGRQIATAQATVTQNIYRPDIPASTRNAENKVMSQRAQLLSQEQTSFANAVNAYVTVIQNEQVLLLRINNEQVLSKQLQATNDRFRVGEITRTDVAQAEAALAGATAQRNTAEGDVQTARATYRQLIGDNPEHLQDPQPLALPVKTQQQVTAIAAINNPDVVTALFNDSAAKDNIDLAFAKLQPNLSLQGQVGPTTNSLQPNTYTNGGQVLAVLSIPIYQGGSEYAAVRSARQTEQQTARQVEEARRRAIQQAAQFWETLVAARATADSTRVQIKANEIALEGVQREAIVGSRTTLDVLNAEQSLLDSRVTLIQNLASVVNASYNVAVAMGRLTAADLKLKVPLYDMTAYYRAVRNRWFGTGDYATDQPSR